MIRPSRPYPVTCRRMGVMLFALSVIGLFLAMKSGSDGLRLVLAIHSFVVMVSAIVLMRAGQGAAQAVAERTR